MLDSKLIDPNCQRCHGTGEVGKGYPYSHDCPACLHHRLRTLNNDIVTMRKVLDAINLHACYASEENTDAQPHALLMIGKLARREVAP